MASTTSPVSRSQVSEETALGGQNNFSRLLSTRKNRIAFSTLRKRYFAIDPNTRTFALGVANRFPGVAHAPHGRAKDGKLFSKDEAVVELYVGAGSVPDCD